MAEPVFTQPERDALLRYRMLKGQNTLGEVGAALGNSGRIIQGKDPLYNYQQPGADNLTAEQRAKAKIALAEVLAKLAEAERAAQSSDQDFQSKKAIISGDILKALIQLDGTKDASAKQLAGQKVDAYAKLQQDAQVRERNAREALQLTPEGMAMVQAAQSQVQGSGVLNSQALLLKVDEDLGTLSRTNPAQIPAYVERFNAAMRATGRPELADFDLASRLGNLAGDQTQTVLVRQLGDKLQRGYDAGLKAGQAREEAATQRDQAVEDLKRAGGSADPALQTLVKQVAGLLIEEPTRDMAPQVKAPPPDATPDAKRAYIERASNGMATLAGDGQVIPTGPVPPAGAPAQQPMSYEGFVQAYPAVRTAGGVVGGQGMIPTGQGYSRSGPTADTIAAIAKLRQNVERQMEDIDKVNLSPMDQARQNALAAAGGQSDFAYQNPNFALRAATRTAAAENRADRRGDRALRDVNVLSGQEAAPLTEKAGALVRQGVRAGVARLGRLGDRIINGRPPAIAAPDFGPPEAALPAEPGTSNLPGGGPPEPGLVPRPVTTEQRDAAAQLWESALSAKTAEEALPFLNEMVRLVPEPSAYREAAKIVRERGLPGRADVMEEQADDLEYQQVQAARGAPVKQPATAEEAVQIFNDTNPALPRLEPWEPDVPGRRDVVARANQDYNEPTGTTGSTLGEKTGRGPLGMFQMGDLGTQQAKATSGATSNPEVTFEPPEAPRPQSQSRGVVKGLGAALDVLKSDEPKSEPSPPAVPMEARDMRYWQQFQNALPREQAPLTDDIKTASTATNVMDMPNFETPDATLLLKRKQRGLVNGATQ